VNLDTSVSTFSNGFAPPPVRDYYRLVLSARLTAAQTRSRSASVKADPLGRQSPFSNSRPDTLPPRTRQSLNTGCRCIGFQSGRASMFSASRAFTRPMIDDRGPARLVSCLPSPVSCPPIVRHVSQRVQRPNGASGMNSMPGRSPSAFR